MPTPVFRIEKTAPSWRQWWLAVQKHWSWALGAQLLLGATGLLATGYGWWHVYDLGHQPPCQWPVSADLIAPTPGSKTATSSKAESSDSQSENQELVVYVAGAVRQPGVFSLAPNSRVAQAIEQAGGLSSQADTQFVAQQLNLAQKISDQLAIYVPFVAEGTVTPFPNSADNANLSSESSLINLNFASLSQLQQLPGIGEKRAEDIVAGRPYTTLTELVDRGVLTKAVFEALSGLITL